MGLNLALLSTKSWQRFEQTHPAAHAFLLQESLMGEYEILRIKKSKGMLRAPLEVLRYEELKELSKQWK